MDEKTETQEVAEDVRPRKSRAAKLVPIAIVALVVVAAAFALSRPVPGTRTTTDTSVSIVVSSAKPQASQAYGVRLLEGNDPGHEADHIIDSLRGLPGVASATLDWSSGLALIVEYDPEVTSADRIAQALTANGYMAPPGQ